MTVFETSISASQKTAYPMNGGADVWFDESVPVDVQTAADAALLSGQLSGMWQRLFVPAAKRRLRSFSSGEAARLIGVSDGYLRQLSLSGEGPQPSNVSPTGRRGYTLQDINALRAHLAAQGGAKARYYLPHRNARAGEHLQVLAVTNVKSGSGKTTTATHVAQYLALRGYRVLAIDLDPQASMSSLLGYQVDIHVNNNKSIYDAIRYDAEQVPFGSVIHTTYFPGVHLSPGNLELQEFEHATSRNSVMGNPNVESASEDRSFGRIQAAIGMVADDYDVVILDCPPQLGFLTLSALYAATAVIVPVNPQMLDVTSMSQFLYMISDMLSVARKAGGPNFSFLRYLITQYDATDRLQTQIAAFLRAQFGERVLTAPMVKSSAISDAALARHTLYELGRDSFQRNTYDRAMESLTAVGAETERLIQAAWGRTDR